MNFLQSLSPSTGGQVLPGLPGFSTVVFLQLVIDLVSVTVLIGLIYYRNYRRTDLFLTFFAFNLLIFLITHLLNQVQLTIGAAFGLFAVFSMLRFRTEGVSVKDMTYLFVVIALGLIAAVIRVEPLAESTIPVGIGQLIVINGMIVGCVYLLESNWLFRRERSHVVHYDRLDLMAPDRKADLLHDLRTRTGLPVHRTDIHEFDLRKDTLRITIYYHPHATRITTITETLVS